MILHQPIFLTETRISFRVTGTSASTIRVFWVLWDHYLGLWNISRFICEFSLYAVHPEPTTNVPQSRDTLTLHGANEQSCRHVLMFLMTRGYLAWPPGNPPVKWESEEPCVMLTIQFLLQSTREYTMASEVDTNEEFLVLSQKEESLSLRYWQFPQTIWKDATTYWC